MLLRGNFRKARTGLFPGNPSRLYEHPALAGPGHAVAPAEGFNPWVRWQGGSNVLSITPHPGGNELA